MEIIVRSLSGCKYVPKLYCHCLAVVWGDTQRELSSR
jgi:hypothetical protein